MVYAGAAKKTVTFMALSLALAFGITLFISENGSITGRAVTSVGTEIPWGTFLFGAFAGAFIIGMYFFVRSQ
jgi:hypothetical protein